MPVRRLLLGLLAPAVFFGVAWIMVHYLQTHDSIADAPRKLRLALYLSPMLIPLFVLMGLHMVFAALAGRPAIRARRGRFELADAFGVIRIPVEEVAAVGLEPGVSPPVIRFVHHHEEDRAGPTRGDRAPPGTLWRMELPRGNRPSSPKVEAALDGFGALLQERRMSPEEAALRYRAALRRRGRARLFWRMVYGIVLLIGLAAQSAALWPELWGL